ncbi:hypothetical protein [Gemmobacter sp. 24YEA27]|uniref:hypothetical protein n=1 Tax=Gemmobacter sp. 24YEA27 TaxID=3040672 RepID=UPI0024B35E33|nr:hypothetical protein [Gemmobacter sp. 24YEA27]
MNDMTPIGIGHNGAPDPIDEINARYEGDRLAAESWADGAKVENEAQMKEADTLRKSMQRWRLDLEKGQKEATTPLRDAYQSELDRWKPTIADAKRIEGCIVAGVDAFKRAEDARKAEIARLAREEEARKQREVEAAAALARHNPADLEAQRAAEAAAREAEQARIAASKASKDTVKGMRTVTRYAFEEPTEANPRGGHRMALNDIAQNDPDAITAFVEEYVRRNHKTRQISGVRVWEEKEAF